jgi:ubiquinone/menaquinone biosynthesis C-methylase UbiE
MNSADALQNRVSAYWSSKPCDSEFSAHNARSREFFLEVECERYRLQSHIPAILDSINWTGKRVLEIGTGVGTDARRIIRAGAIYTGINVDLGSTHATAAALQTFGMTGTVVKCDATRLAFGDQSFDFVYSFGVLHHIPNVEKAMQEIRRVLAPTGEVLAMLYNRSSINYAVEIKYLRKLGVRALDLPGALHMTTRS